MSRVDAAAGRSITDRFKQWRHGIRQRRTMNTLYRAAVGVVGTIVALVGVLAIPYPGPGWAIVIVGLAILATEFAWAHRVLHLVRRYYHGWTRWLGAQPRGVQALVLLATAAIVVLTLWVIGALALVAGWVGQHPTWLQSPL